MSVHKLARSGYSLQAIPTRTLKGTEYEVFGKLTRKIKDASRNGPNAFPQLAAALHENRKLWTLLALDVSGPGNKLSEETRARIIYLNQFVQVQTGKVLSKQADVQSLIDINVSIMRGLRG